MKKVIDLINTQDEEKMPQARWVRVEKEKPAKRNKTEKREFEKVANKRVRTEKAKKSGAEKPIGFSLKVALIIVAAVIVAAGAGFVWLTLNPNLILTLRMKQEPLELREEVELSVSQAVLDVAKRIVPAQFFEETQEKSQTFKATGVAFEDKKAKGVIKVYNNTNPPTILTLRKDTRFLSSGGAKIFKAIDKVVLSAPVQQGGKIIPSVVDVQAVAQDVGDEYNIGPSKFSVPGLAGTNFYYAVWGESDQAMVGGSTKEVPAISEVDKENAKSNLYETLKDLLLGVIKEKAPAGYTLDERAVIENDFNFICAEPTSTPNIENNDLSFTCSGKLSLKALAFKADDLETLALSLFNERKSAGREVRPESLQVSLAPKGAVTQSGRLVISLGAGIKTYEALNQDVFLNRILGKNKEQIEQIAAADFPAIESVDFKFWPFWLKKAPSAAESVELRLTF